jgi:hypothetical protein
MEGLLKQGPGIAVQQVKYFVDHIDCKGGWRDEQQTLEEVSSKAASQPFHFFGKLPHTEF